MKAFRPVLARAAASPLWVLALTVLADAALLIVNRTVYAGVISMQVPQLLVVLSACWCIFTLRLDLEARGYRVFRVLLPLVPLVHGFGRVGCFLTGCCYGVPSRFGIAFSHSPIAPNGVRLLPVQLIEAACEGVLFFALTRPGAQRRGGRWMLGVYLASYGVLRFILEFFRGDDYRGFLGALSLSQVISIATLLLAAALLIPKRTQKSCPG